MYPPTAVGRVFELDFSVSGYFESLLYSATITGPSGTRTDEGTADFHADAFGYDCYGDIYTVFGSMQEEFVRSMAVSYADVCALALEYSTDPAVAESLCEKLDAAEAAELRGATEVKVRQLAAFTQQVEAQTGKSLTPEQADELLSLLAQL